MIPNCRKFWKLQFHEVYVLKILSMIFEMELIMLNIYNS